MTQAIDDAPLRFASLGSGSRGNCALVETGDTCLMIDCGFSVKQTERRLARLGRRPSDLDAILVTHEHGDHVGGVERFARRHRIDVWMTPGTHVAVGHWSGVEVRHIDCHETFRLGAIDVRPFPVPHDAREPCQFTFGDGVRRLGVLTDVGTVTPHIRRSLADCDALVLEANHDSDLLAESAYPPSVRARVGGRLGHLNNLQAAELLAGLDHERLQWVAAVHLSERNNTPELALEALNGAVGRVQVPIEAACQDEGLAWRGVR